MEANLRSKVLQNALGAFCNTFGLHLAIIGLENHVGILFEWPLNTGFTGFYFCEICDTKFRKSKTMTKLRNHFVAYCCV